MTIETECSADGTSIIVREDNLIEALKASMSRKLGPAKSPLPVRSCIFKVPQVLRRHNEKAYEPHVVSIGPYNINRRGEQFQRMETVKQWYFNNLLTRMKICSQEFIQLINDETKGIIEFEKCARDFYAEPLVHLKEKEFMEIMILDGCFIIQLLRKFKEHEEKKDDPILNMPCMFQYVCHDLLLLENQLPWSVLSCLYRLTLGSYPNRTTKFSELLLDAFRSLESLDHNCKSYHDYLNDHGVNDNEVLHILDLIRTSIVFTFKPKVEDTGSDDHPPTSTTLQNCKKCLCWFAGKEEEEISDIPSATALSEAGVTFVKSSADNPNIEFKNGVFTIPKLAVGELTEPLFRNLIAFEQCCHDFHHRHHEITSYAVLMDKLISSKSDLELLYEKKIISNWLSVEDGSKFFSNLYTDTAVIEFRYDQLFSEVNKYYQVKWNKDYEQFRRDYCSTPWKAIALAVGTLLLVVNLWQLVISLQSSTVFTGIRVNELSADI